MSETAQAKAPHTSPQQRELPSGWRWVRLREFMPKNVGSLNPTMNPDEIFALYSIPAFDRGAPDIVFGKAVGSTKQIVLSGDVLLSKIVPHIRRTCVVGSDTGRRMIASTEWIVFRTTGADSEYLKYALTDDDFHREFMDTTSGVGGSLLRARPALVAQIQIPLPPLSEQQRIAGVLREQMAAVEKARAAAQVRLAAVKDLPAAFLRQVFPQPGQPLPDGWRWVKLGEVLQETRNGLYKPDTYYGTGTRILKMFNIGRLDGSWDLKRVDLIELTEDEERIYGLDEGDILFNRVNSNELVGKCAVIDSRTAGAVFESKNIRLRLNPIQTDPFFVATFMNSQGGRNQIQQRLKQIVGQATVNRSDLDSFEIPLPLLPEQQRIAGVLREQMETVEKTRAAAQEELNIVNALPAALLRRAFNGEL